MILRKSKWLNLRIWKRFHKMSRARPAQSIITTFVEMDVVSLLHFFNSKMAKTDQTGKHPWTKGKKWMWKRRDQHYGRNWNATNLITPFQIAIKCRPANHLRYYVDCVDCLNRFVLGRHGFWSFSKNQMKIRMKKNDYECQNQQFLLY